MFSLKDCWFFNHSGHIIGDFKKMFIIVCIFIISFSNLCFSGISPYYSFELSEGIYLPNRGLWGYTTILTNDLGLVYKPANRHSLFTLFELRYTGPGLKRRESETFEQRSMSNIFMLQYNFNITKEIISKIRLNSTVEYWRTGANEIWTTGLYDTNNTGGGIELEVNKTGIKAFFGLKYSLLKFPNYTDLLEEYKTGSEEISTGKQDNNMYQISTGLYYEKNVITFDVIVQNYLKQYVIEESGIASKTQLQRDISAMVYLNRKESLIENFLDISPFLIFRYKDSNQAYLHFETFASTTPAYLPDYYDYIRISFGLPFNIYFSKTKSLTISPEFEITNYSSRPPRDQNNNIIFNQKQNNNLSIIYFGYNYKPDPSTKTTLFYIFQTQTSNMKFEKYFPYNYSGKYFGIQFSYSY